MDMDRPISMDIHAKICGYGYGYGWEISYPRQAWRLWRIYCLQSVCEMAIGCEMKNH